MREPKMMKNKRLRWKKSEKLFPQVRLELTTPALLKRTVYKYRALTDCATGDKGMNERKIAKLVFSTLEKVNDYICFFFILRKLY